MPVTEMYRPIAQTAMSELHARGQDELGTRRRSRRPARAAVQAIDPNLPIYDVRTMEDRIAGSFAQTRGTMLLLLVTAVLAAALSGVAIYGSIWYSVSQRMPEIGVRLALGASRGSVFVDVLRRAVALTGIGRAIGVAGTLAGGRLIAGLLFDTRATDPVTSPGRRRNDDAGARGRPRPGAARHERGSDDRPQKRVGDWGT